MSDGVKLGQLLCDADIITKRQLSKALQAQVKGNKGTIGEILVEMNFCDFDDITDALMNSQSDTKKHEEKHEEIHQEPIPVEIKPEVKDIPPVEEPKKEEVKRNTQVLLGDTIGELNFLYSLLKVSLSNLFAICSYILVVSYSK